MKKTVLPHPAKAEEWREAFKSSCVRVGFAINLSKPMLEFLCAVSEGVQWDRSRFGTINFPDNWLASERSLTKRGLIERRTGDENYIRVDKIGEEERAAGEWCPCRLTPAGKVVVELVKLTGLFVEADAAITKKLRAKK